MISQFVFGCVFEAVSGALVAAIWLKWRKSERERALQEDELEAHAQEADELRGELEGVEAELETQREELETLRAAGLATEPELRSLRDRCAELEAVLSHQSDLEGSSNGRAGELESRTALVAGLQGELAAKEQELEAQVSRSLKLQAELDTALRAALSAADERRESEVLEERKLAQALREELAAAEGRAALLQSRADEALLLEAQLAESRGVLAENAESLARMERALQERENELAGLQTLAESRGREQTLETARQAEELALARGSLDQAGEEVRGLRQEIVRLGEECGSLRSDLERERSEAAATAAKLNAGIAERDARGRAQAEAAVEAANLQTRTAARGLALELCLSEREAELHDAQAQLERLQEQASAGLLRAEALGRRCRELESEVAAGASREHEQRAEWTARREEFQAQALLAEEALRDRAILIERLEAGMAAKDARIDDQAARCQALEQDLRVRERESVEARERAQENAARSAGREAELEGRLAAREEETQRLACEVARREQLLSALEQRTASLVQELEAAREAHQAERERAEALLSEEPVTQRILAARAGDLEVQLAHAMEELARQAETNRSLRETALTARMELDSAALREGALEAELGRRGEAVDERHAALRTRAEELEVRLLGANEAAGGLRRECAKLTERCAALWNLVETRAHELERRDEELHEARASLEVLDYAVQSCHDEIRKRDELLEIWTENRLENLFERRHGGRANALPAACREGLQQGDLELALRGFLGDASPLSAELVGELCARWTRNYEEWRRAPIDREVVYLWADGLHPTAGAAHGEQALLVVVGAYSDGTRALLAAQSGERGSKDCWLELCLNLASRGMNVPRIAVADRSLGLWDALDELGWNCARQYCWSYASAALLSALPRERRAPMAKWLQALVAAETRVESRAQRDALVRRCGSRHAEAAQAVTAHWKELSRYQSFPKEHWSHLRTTESLTAPLEALHLRADSPKQVSTVHPTPHLESILWRLLSAALHKAPALDALELTQSLVTAPDVARPNVDGGHAAAPELAGTGPQLEQAGTSGDPGSSGADSPAGGRARRRRRRAH
jgi:putative transposase